MYLKKKNPNGFDTTRHHQAKKILSTNCIFYILSASTVTQSV